ncbi:MAG TPA: hypothetical protein VEC14_02200 [Reyranellaceae bacterium]|nr:hypothetical protein [Reyranellaceae bacterium]
MRNVGSLDLRFLNIKPGRGGKRYFWKPTPALQAAGWRSQRLDGAEADPAARELAAFRACDARNRELEQWRLGAAPGHAPARLKGAQPGTVAALISAYRKSRFFRDLAAKTRRDYEQCLALIEEWAGEDPAASIDAQDAEEFYSEMRPTKPAMAAAVIRVARLVWNWAPRLPGAPKLEKNPFEKPGIRSNRPRPRIWSRQAVDAMVAAADALGWHSIGTAIVLNEWLGQREGDILKLPRELDLLGDLIVEQNKTGAVAPLPISVVPALMARRGEEIARQLGRQAAAKVAPIALPPELVLHELTGKPWNEHTFRHMLAELRFYAVVAAANAGQVELARELDSLQFKHLRHTAVTRLAEANVNVERIAAITGHSLATVNQILEHYLLRTRKLARGAFEQRLAAEAKEQEA